jgi:hypothetical protein
MLLPFLVLPLSCCLYSCCLNGVLPITGQKICVANEYFESGEGAYEFGSHIYASVVGWLHVQEFTEQEVRFSI